MLNNSQVEAFEKIKSLLYSREKRIKVLGAAGTGKTFLVNHVVKHILQSNNIGDSKFDNGLVFVTAPTNKALSVLKSKVTQPVEFKTVHSALQLSMFVDNATGDTTFTNYKGNNHTLESSKAMIIDECSMLNLAIEGGQEKEGYRVGYLDSYNIPIIYTGDPNQINPVGEKNSAVFEKDYPTVTLTEIVRQEEGNPIIQLSRDIDKLFFKIPEIESGKGYYYSNNESQIIDMLCEVNGTDELKYLAFTNNQVNSINRKVREKIYKNPSLIEEGETLIFDSMYKNHYTNEEIKVSNLAVDEFEFTIPTINTRFRPDLTVIRGDLDRVKLKTYLVNKDVYILHEDSLSDYRKILNKLNEKCKKEGWSYRAKSYFIGQFAKIKYNHAITVHKSQGSTYKKTIINIGNIMFNPSESEKNRLLYTAITRASDLVILNNVK